MESVFKLGFYVWKNVIVESVSDCIQTGILCVENLVVEYVSDCIQTGILCVENVVVESVFKQWFYVWKSSKFWNLHSDAFSSRFSCMVIFRPHFFCISLILFMFLCHCRALNMLTCKERIAWTRRTANTPHRVSLSQTANTAPASSPRMASYSRNNRL